MAGLVKNTPVSAWVRAHQALDEFVDDPRLGAVLQRVDWPVVMFEKPLRATQPLGG